MIINNQQHRREQPPTRNELSSFSSDDFVHPVKNNGTLFKWMLFCDPFASPEATKKPKPNNPNLTKEELAMIEQIQARIDAHHKEELDDDEMDEVDKKLRAQIADIDDQANLRALQQRWMSSVTSLW